jgi:hypothetical protein
VTPFLNFEADSAADGAGTDGIYFQVTEANNPDRKFSRRSAGTCDREPHLIAREQLASHKGQRGSSTWEGWPYVKTKHRASQTLFYDEASTAGLPPDLLPAESFRNQADATQYDTPDEHRRENRAARFD